MKGIHGLSFALPMAVSAGFFWHLALVPHYAASKNGSIRSVGLSERSLTYRILRGGDGVLPIYVLEAMYENFVLLAVVNTYDVA